MQVANYVFHTEGLRPLIWKAFSLLKDHLLQYGTCYVYHETLEDRNEADFLPKIDNFNFKVVYTNQQADELAAHGLDFRSPGIIDIDRLDKGAIAFCIFVGKELAHKNWVATTEHAKSHLTWLPFEVDFSNNQAYVGSVVTNPKFRGLGLWTYCYFKITQLLREKGIVATRYVLFEGNIDHQKRLAKKFSIKPYAEAKYLRILCWKHWKEKPIMQKPGLWDEVQ